MDGVKTGWFAPLTEDAGLHEGGEVGSPVGCERRAGVIATHPCQPGIDDVVRDQLLSEEDEPKLVVSLKLIRRRS